MVIFLVVVSVGSGLGDGIGRCVESGKRCHASWTFAIKFSILYVMLSSVVVTALLITPLLASRIAFLCLVFLGMMALSIYVLVEFQLQLLECATRNLFGDRLPK
jgi:hypothetical protein